jgi:site-specific recombinase XerD
MLQSIIPYHEREHMTLDQCILAWISAKRGRSDSPKTEKAYRDTLTQFRAMLQSTRRDLDSDPGIVAPLAQGWAGHSNGGTRRAEVTPATYNQRLAILSSFYAYAIKNDVLAYNPIERVERRNPHKQYQAQPIATGRVKSGLASIDRSTFAGKRDYALLSVALATGKRLSEVTNIRYGDLQKQGDTCVIAWPRCKGNKRLDPDVLKERTTRALYDYLYAAFGTELGTLANDARIWLSDSDRNRRQPIDTRTVQRVSMKYLGTSKVHATRHTWAVAMMHQNATLAQIGKRLGHSNLKTTSDYLDELSVQENPHAAAIEELFDI